MQSTLFPHDTVRDQQDLLITKVFETIDHHGQLLVHAPTGLGKTAATLAPAIERAIALNKVVIFMTSRLTQHALALDTVSRIRQRHNVHIPVIDLIGKKHMCLQPGVDNLGGKEFAEYCKSVREDGLCEYYSRLRQGEVMSLQTKTVLVQLGQTAPNTPEQVKMVCAEPDNRLCPYEVTMLLAKDARVVITDYSYMFNETIRDGFFKRINRELSDCILIVDEAHNLPDRVKDLATERLSSYVLRRAIVELQRLQREDHKHHLQQFADLLEELSAGMQSEKYIRRDELLDGLRLICPPEQLIDDLEEIAILVREEQKSSSCGTIADFITAWSGDDDGYARILSKLDRKGREHDVESDVEDNSGVSGQLSLFGNRISVPSGIDKPSSLLELRYRCLDPGLITKPVFDAAYSTIIMSGTLTPTSMYAVLLGTTDAQELTLVSPFPKVNRLNLIVPKTTTKFTTRSAQMYAEIGKIVSQIVNVVPGNSAIFFPSYNLLSEVKSIVDQQSSRTIFSEHPSYTKEEREDLLMRFRSYKASGAVLLGVMGGSFSEGIDLPGDELRAVVVVGLPLGRPDLETKSLIDYYQQKFGKGWEYGYTFPAFNKTLQSAGRCIRTETDKGVIIFLDERYAWASYVQSFPQDWYMKITLRYEDIIREFFADNNIHLGK